MDKILSDVKWNSNHQSRDNILIVESITDVSNMIISDLGKRGFEYTESNRKSLENKIATFNN